MLKQRLIFGFLLTGALVALIAIDDRLDKLDLSDSWLQTVFAGRTYLPRGVVLLPMILLLIPIAARELAAVFHAKGVPADPRLLAAGPALACALMYILPYRMDSQPAIAIVASAIVLVMLAAAVRHGFIPRQTQGVTLLVAATVFAVIYLGILPGFYLGIRRFHSAWVVVSVILVIKSADIGAYAVGRTIGRHKLIPWLSPGKTWEGLVGGLAFSALAGVGLAALSNHFQIAGLWVGAGAERAFEPSHYDLGRSAIAGLIFGAVGQGGDLFASLLKRDAGIKDSGGSIPGFGGVIDVVDSPILVAPFAYWMLTLGRSFG